MHMICIYVHYLYALCFYTGRSDECVHGTVRLTGNKADNSSGYVEVCLGGSYTGICAIDWSDEDAQVVCRQLGQSVEGSTQMADNAWTMPNITTVTEFLCVGNESHLVQCGFSQIDPGSCSTSSAGVRCGCKCSLTVILCFTGAIGSKGIPSSLCMLTVPLRHFQVCSLRRYDYSETSIKDILSNGHLSNEDTHCSPNHIELCIQIYL